MKTAMTTADLFLRNKESGDMKFSVEMMRQFFYDLHHIETDSEITDDGTLYRDQDLSDAFSYTEDLMNLGPGMNGGTSVPFRQRCEEAKNLADADVVLTYA